MKMSASEKAIQRCYAFLEENISSLDSLLGRIFQAELIDGSKMTQIRRTTNPREQVEILLLDCLSGRSINDLKKFCDILLESERKQSMFVHGQAARRLLQEIDKVEREGVPRAPEHRPSSRPHSSSSNSRNQTSGSGTSANWTFPDFPPGFPFSGGLPNFPPGTSGTIISGNKIENSQINIVGTVSNSSVHFNRGQPHPRGPRVATPRGGANGGYSQGQATPTPHDCHEAGHPADGPPLSTQSSDQDPRFDAEPTLEQFYINVLSVVEGNVFEFYRELGVNVPDERDGGTNRESAARILRENPGISWRQILEALRRVGRADQARDLEQRIRFGTI